MPPVAHIKSDEERGAFGAWAYHARLRLELSDAQVVEALPTKYNPATLRKLEGGSGSAKMRDELSIYYRSQALLRGMAMPDPPSAKPVIFDPMRELITALHAQTATMADLVAEMRLAREDREDQLTGIQRGVAKSRGPASSGSSTGRRSPAVAQP